VKDLQRIPLFAIALIVLLRLAIGWQFLYEGMWKYDTMDSARPWTAEGYLKNAQGPFRDTFRNMTGDPNDYAWLDFGTVSAKWYAWRDRFVQHYQLDEKQQSALNKLLDGTTATGTDAAAVPAPTVHRQKLGTLPPSVNLERYKNTVVYDTEKKELVVKQPVLPSEEATILSMIDVVHVAGDEYRKRIPEEELAAAKEEGRAPKTEKPDAAEVQFFKVFDRLTTLSRRVSYREKLAANLLGNPDNVGVMGRLNKRGTFDFVMGTVTEENEGKAQHNVKYGKVQEYVDLVNDYEAELKNASMSYQTDHAQKLSVKLAGLRAELVNPIRALDAEFKTKAAEILTREQFESGPLPPENTPMYQSDQMAMWGLIILGALLIVGFFTRLSALAGAVMLMSFYLVMPPWPGVPPAPGPEHSFIINKNLIEVIALLGIAALPTGTWFGIDGLIYRTLGGGSKPMSKLDEKSKAK